jgi:hypothetical protein
VPGGGSPGGEIGGVASGRRSRTSIKPASHDGLLDAFRSRRQGAPSSSATYCVSHDAPCSQETPQGAVTSALTVRALSVNEARQRLAVRVAALDSPNCVPRGPGDARSAGSPSRLFPSGSRLGVSPCVPWFTPSQPSYTHYGRLRGPLSERGFRPFGLLGRGSCRFQLVDSGIMTAWDMRFYSFPGERDLRLGLGACVDSFANSSAFQAGGRGVLVRVARLRRHQMDLTGS